MDKKIAKWLRTRYYNYWISWNICNIGNLTQISMFLVEHASILLQFDMSWVKSVRIAFEGIMCYIFII